jgi:hypothetical protein
MRRYYLSNGLQLESITLWILQVLVVTSISRSQKERRYNIFSICICICPRNTIEIQMNFNPNPSAITLHKTFLATLAFFN